MKLHTTLLFVVLLLLMSAPATQAQHPGSDAPADTVLLPTNVSGQVSFLVGMPQGRFADQVLSTGFGGAFAVFADLGQSPFKVGAELGGMIYGTERRREPFSTTIPDVTVGVETTNNIGLGHLVVRMAPEAGILHPYVDGLFGFKYLFTRTDIRSDHIVGVGPVAASTNFDDFALSYGMGGGLVIDLYRGMIGHQMGALRLDMGLRYLFGGEAEYLRRGSIRREDGQVQYDVLSSRTNMLIPQVGLVLKF